MQNKPSVHENSYYRTLYFQGMSAHRQVLWRSALLSAVMPLPLQANLS
jgi:hypothetical protein